MAHSDHSKTHPSITDLINLITMWQEKAARSARIAHDPISNSEATYYNRGAASAYREAAAALHKLLEQNPKETAEITSMHYAAVSKSQVENLLKQKNIKYDDLYEDEGSIFTVVFPGAIAFNIEEKIERLETTAPAVTILETGRLSSGEPYVDFAFEILK